MEHRKCPQILLVPIANAVLIETRKSCGRNSKQCGFDGQVFNPLKLSTVVVSHANTVCEGLLDNVKLNEIVSKSSSSTLNHTPPFYVKAIKNSRRRMEDRHTCISDFNGMFGLSDTQPTSFYGVFDGHGGQDAAIYAAAHIAYNIANSSNYPSNIQAAIREAFLKTDEDFIVKSDKHSIYSGTTALVCINRTKEKKIFFGWVGDSQALLVSEGKLCQIVSPHVPSVENEKIRIEKLGGVVVNWKGLCRVNGLLAISRAIGDASHKPFIISDPDTSFINLDNKEDFLIIASDGLWESLSEDDIALFVYRYLVVNPECTDTVAEALIEKARKGTTDNITVVIIFFKNPSIIAKSAWLRKMEDACDSRNSSNSTFANEELSTIVASEYINNESNNDYTTNDNPPKIIHKSRLEDELGPETDVDGQEDVTPTKSSDVMEKNITDLNSSNSTKLCSLENKILMHLSEQNKDLLIIDNPFENDHFNQLNNLQTRESQTIMKRTESFPESPIDNRIMDAFVSLSITNGRSVKHNINDENGDSASFNNSSIILENKDLSEKVDIMHENYMPISQGCSNKSQDDIGPTTIDCDLIHVPEESGEEEEEEEEWNYIDCDKKTDDDLHGITIENNNIVSEIYDLLDHKDLLPTASNTVKNTLEQEKKHFKFINIVEGISNAADQEMQKSETANDSVVLKNSQEEINLKVDCTELPDIATDSQDQEQQPVQFNTLIDKQFNRPDSLFFEMASKLNPEAKEFVPIGSPSRSAPTSPVSQVPVVLRNSYLLLSDDTLISQSPKRGVNIMDNINVPAEDDFKQEMSNRPHEFEMTPDCSNGNVDTTIRLHLSSESSYQEMNSKEAMQRDEKLDNEYSDERQILIHEIGTEPTIESSLLNILSKEQNPINTSFYEGRNEVLLSSNSDELNKVQILPDDYNITQKLLNYEEKCESNQLEERGIGLNTSEKIRAKSETIKTRKQIDLTLEELHSESHHQVNSNASVSDSNISSLLEQKQIDATIIEKTPSLDKIEPKLTSLMVDVTENEINLKKNYDKMHDSIINLVIHNEPSSREIVKLEETVKLEDCESNRDFFVDAEIAKVSSMMESLQQKINKGNNNDYENFTSPTASSIEGHSTISYDGIMSHELGSHIETLNDIPSYLQQNDNIIEVKNFKSYSSTHVNTKSVHDNDQINKRKTLIDLKAQSSKLKVTKSIDTKAKTLITAKSVKPIVETQQINTKTAIVNADNKGPTTSNKSLTKPITKATIMKPYMMAMKKNTISNTQKSSNEPVLTFKSYSVATARTNESKRITDKNKLSAISKQTLPIIANDTNYKSLTTTKKVATGAPKPIATTSATGSISGRQAIESATATRPASSTSGPNPFVSVKPRTSTASSFGKPRTVSQATTKSSDPSTIYKTNTTSITQKGISNVKSATRITPMATKSICTVSKTSSSNSRTSTSLKTINTLLKPNYRAASVPKCNKTNTTLSSTMKMDTKSSPVDKKELKTSNIASLAEKVSVNDVTKI
ncbi:uncharacterized protein LOC131432714 isoform X2 [Malaya genurostris]|uniref:uncharacterized protein LOC131432714 isoform X2 n=1 Tax=Malaya genurostris TaxID=325434 RepID=UPI0026F39FCA|nr:uncharacterized protein LOC131432714 isoform X2 [Malaya genurostris]